MVDWDPKEQMGSLSYLWFKLGRWVEVETVPKWVLNVSDPPKKTNIPLNGSVEAIFTGDRLEYKVITKRLPRGAGSYTEQEYAVRIKNHGYC
jgi:hypothetical protein